MRARLAVFLGSLSAVSCQPLQHDRYPDPFEFGRADSEAPSFDASPMNHITIAELPGLLTRLMPQSVEHGVHHKINMRLSNSTIQFMLWLPRGFGQAQTGPWPTVFFLHGAAEGQFPGGRGVSDLGGCAPFPCTIGSEISKVARHGLPHKVESNAPFGTTFVLVSPQKPMVDGLDDGWSKWSDHLPALEELRTTLFASSVQFDAQRAYLTGLSSGAVGTWAWAGFNPSGQQPWAAVAATSGAWPYHENDHDPETVRPLERRAIERLARMNVLVSHCTNDMTFEIEMGAKGEPSCVLQRLNGDQALMCGFAADAIVEALQDAGAANNLRYDRLEDCRSPRMPTDTGPLKASWYSSLQEGHDAWSRLYASADFTHWLLRHRLNSTGTREGSVQPAVYYL